MGLKSVGAILSREQQQRKMGYISPHGVTVPRLYLTPRDSSLTQHSETGFMLSPTMSNVDITQIMQWKPSLAPNLNKKMGNSSKSYFRVKMTHEPVSSTLANLLHPQSQTPVQRRVWGSPHNPSEQHRTPKYAPTAHLLLLLHISLPLYWRSLLGCPIWLRRHQLASLHWKIPPEGSALQTSSTF